MHRGVVAKIIISLFYTNLILHLVVDMLNNIRNRFCNKQACLVIFSTVLSFYISAQEITYTRPLLTDKWDEYKQQVKKDSSKKMAELKKLIPGIVYDLRYATVNNFMHRLMYPKETNTTFLRLPAAKALQRIQLELNQSGLGVKIFDAYRPYSVTVKFWELVKDERYVANPSKGSGHNRGIAVDLTIVNLKNNQELNMGTGFDNFSDTAHHSFSNLPEDILQNRLLLKTIMEKYGFKTYEDEWWHYSFAEGSRFEILDIDFKKLNKDL
jgi:zinc D-Ala-D-Ala dipeptidase